MTDDAKKKRAIFRSLGCPPNVWPPMTIPFRRYDGTLIEDIYQVMDWCIDVGGDQFEIMVYCDECDGEILVKYVTAAGRIVCKHGPWTQERR